MSTTASSSQSPKATVPALPTEIWLRIFHTLDLSSRPDLTALWSLRHVSRSFRQNVEDVFLRTILPRTYIVLCLEVGDWPRPTHRSYSTKVELRDFQFVGFDDGNENEVGVEKGRGHRAEYKRVSRPSPVNQRADMRSVLGNEGGADAAALAGRHWTNTNWAAERQGFGLKRPDIVQLAREHDSSSDAHSVCKANTRYCTPWGAFLGPRAPVGFFGGPSYDALDEWSEGDVIGGVAFPGQRMNMEFCREGFAVDWRSLFGSWLAVEERRPVLGLLEIGSWEFGVVRGVKAVGERRPFTVSEEDGCHRSPWFLL